MILGVDVDLTVVDSLKPWLDWFEDRTGRRVQNADGNYDLVPEMHQIMKEARISGKNWFDPMEFWHYDNLYDGLEPLEGAVDALAAAKDSGWTILFISSCIPDHERSKKQFLKRHFPFASAFISTHDKQFIDYDILIDDKLEHARQGMIWRPDSRHIVYTMVRKDGKPGEAEKFETLDSWGNLQTKLGFSPLDTNYEASFT